WFLQIHPGRIPERLPLLYQKAGKRKAAAAVKLSGISLWKITTLPGYLFRLRVLHGREGGPSRRRQKKWEEAENSYCETGKKGL
ncbi:MAG: hypothetical protein IJT94_08620, partial [Oscillibacter sp.]|nr:hypothetical protein [Oscillibacter sp.]